MTMTRDEVKLCLDECVVMSNWYFDEQNWALSEQWGIRAEQWQARLNALDAQQQSATGEGA